MGKNNSNLGGQHWGKLLGGGQSQLRMQGQCLLKLYAFLKLNKNRDTHVEALPLEVPEHKFPYLLKGDRKINFDNFENTHCNPSRVLNPRWLHTP